MTRSLLKAVPATRVVVGTREGNTKYRLAGDRLNQWPCWHYSAPSINRYIEVGSLNEPDIADRIGVDIGLCYAQNICFTHIHGVPSESGR